MLYEPIISYIIINNKFCNEQNVWEAIMKTEKNILIAFLLNLAFAIFEFVGGIFTGSVAILSDAPNQEKACCQNVIPPVVCDTNGRVYWQSDNGVYSFPIGYPRRVSWIHGGEKFAHIRIHTYRDRLFLYRLNRLNRHLQG